MSESSGGDRRAVLTAAVIGAVATVAAAVVAGLIGHQQGVNEAGPAATVTISPPVATVTVTAKPGGSTGSVPPQGPGSIPPSLVRNLAAPLSSSGETGLDLGMGQVVDGPGNVIYVQDGATGLPKLSLDEALGWSLDVNSKNASRQQCVTAIAQFPFPDHNSITRIHKGLLFCVKTGSNSFALVEITQNLTGLNKLYVQDTYWADPSQ